MNEAYSAGDLAFKRDLLSVVTVVRERPRRPEASDHLVVREIWARDPKASATREIDFGEVRAYLGQLPQRFPALQGMWIEQGAEASSVLPWARQHPRLSLLVKPFIATADSNMAIWSALVARLNARTISIPRHDRLLSELRGLRAESFAFGSKWRVVDSSRKFHRDVSFSLALAVFAAGVADDYVPLTMTAVGPGGSETFGGESDAQFEREMEALLEASMAAWRKEQGYEN